MKLFNADNREALKELPDNSVDSVVTDPPYGLSFMNKKWDYDVPSVEFWKEVYRVLKPGGHILSFGGTRTYHRMVVNIEDAGFEIRDQIMWIYGSGFPKSLNIGKAVDKIEGNEREMVGWQKYHRNHNNSAMDEYKRPVDLERQGGFAQTKGTSPYEGFGTALKPSNEPIVLARKPLSEKSIAENVMRWRTGGLNIDGCRVEYISESDKESAKPGSLNATGENSMFGLKSGNEQNDTGRFPANVILECICDEVIKGEKGKIQRSNGRDRSKHQYNSVGNVGSYDGTGTIDNYNDKGDIHTNPDCPCYIMDEQSGVSKTTPNENYKWNNTDCEGNTFASRGKYTPRSDKGGASRFFFKTSYNFLEQNEYKMKTQCPQNNYKLVRYVEQSGLNISQITELIALANVPENLKNKLVLLVRHAVNLSEKCTMYIVANIVAIATENMESPLIQDFITELENYILIQNLAHIVEIQDNIDTTPTTQSLMKLFGSALRAIEKHMPQVKEQEVEEQKLEQNKSICRFKYQAKVSKKERNLGLDDFEENEVVRQGLAGEKNNPIHKNNHPTLKPINLLTYLCRLITPPNGVVLDPFMGSGSTGVAALLEGFDFIGMELEKDYYEIAEQRIKNYELYKKILK